MSSPSPTTPNIRLVFAIHDHQPVGNFDGVFEQACRDAYEPFLDVIDDFPEIPITMHISGSLLEWLESHRPDLIERVRDAVSRNRMEILGGPYFEPILAAIPSCDRGGQIKAYTHHLEHLFQTKVRGMWVPERVWEPNFASDIADAGIEYTILDDSHFRWAGFSDDKLHGYYLTEDDGKLLKVFPNDEHLRYTIPWADPQESIAYLREMAEKFPGSIVSVGDDGEKFGSWPGTYEHVYANGWMRTFFQALRDNADWLQVVTMSQAVNQVAPLGKVYLPNASYREMTEWALPTDQQVAYKKLIESKQEDPDWEVAKPFVRAGFWRNFLAKYPESNEMYCRSQEVSRRLQRVLQTEIADERPDLVHLAQMELYRGQCNCPFWHGAFGGLYLPHLRNAIYKHLIAADGLLDQLEGRSGRWVSITADDFNLDARKEVRMAGDRLVAYLAPARGGHVYELDVRGAKTNLLATMNRRPEPYHQSILDAAGVSDDVDDVDFNTHAGIRFKQADLDKQIAYDRYPRKSLVDHFLLPGTDLEEFRAGNGEIGDFVLGVHETKIRESANRVETVMSRDGRVDDNWIRMTKTVALDTTAGSQLEICYELDNLPPGEPVHFAVEFNFASMAAGSDDRYFYDSDGQQIGQLQSVRSLEAQSRIGIVDEWLGIDNSLEFSVPGDVWTFPIQTVSQSEGGFELVHQSSVVVPHWEIIPGENGRWSVTIQLVVDTSIAHARLLADVSTRG